MRVLAIVHQRDAGPGVFAEAVASRGARLEEWHVSEAPAPAVDHDAVIVLGGAVNADQDERHPWLSREKALLERLVQRGVPLLGVCLGAQLLAAAAGGEALRASEPEIGWREVSLEPAACEDPLLAPLPERLSTLQWHSYEAVPPPGAVILARSAVCAQAFRLGERPAWGIQFHAEVTLASFEHWCDDYRNDPDAVRIGVDPEALKEQTRERVAGWNELGRGVCARFLDAAEG